jgi:RNA polymerase sigma factor (TIGR02999 family)
LNETPPLSDGELPREVYEQLHAIARVRMANERKGHTLQATALMHEALMRFLDDGRIGGIDRPTFFRAAAETMRRILIDHARARARDKRGGAGAARHRVTLDGIEVPANEEKIIEILALDEAICRLKEQSSDAATVVQLRFYAGLSVDETAETLGLSPRSVDRLWAFARASLWRTLHEQDDSKSDGAAAL